jgi:predicted RNase H-like HicB family nuclease
MKSIAESQGIDVANAAASKQETVESTKVPAEGKTCKSRKSRLKSAEYLFRAHMLCESKMVYTRVDDGFEAECVHFPGCSGWGETEAVALKDYLIALDTWMQTCEKFSQLPELPELPESFWLPDLPDVSKVKDILEVKRGDPSVEEAIERLHRLKEQQPERSEEIGATIVRAQNAIEYLNQLKEQQHPERAAEVDAIIARAPKI